jgi:hypothetical protein
MEKSVRVLATPEAYEVMMKFETPIARRILDEIFAYVNRGFSDDRNGLAVLFPDSPPYFRVFHSPSPDEPSTVLITNKIVFDDLEEVLESCLPVSIV